jgi:STE24 endopeptidase
LNFIAVIILVALAFDACLHFTADLLNLKNMSPELPETFQGVYDTERYSTSQTYLKTNTHFEWIVTGINLFALLAFWFLGGFNALDHFSRGLGWGTLPTGIVYIGLLLLLKGVLNTPFGIYHTFVIEERFGFNKTTWKTYLLDRAKGLLLTILIGFPLLGGILAFFEYSGGNAWWYCWIVVVVISMSLRFIAPTWILPLFNKFTPLEDGELKSELFALAKRIHFPLKNVFLMDGSKRSTKSNAFFTGFGRNKRIVLFDTLTDKTTVPELLAVLGHEMGHYKLKHLWVQTVVSVVHTGLLFYLLSLFISLPLLFDAFFVETPSVYGGMIFFGMLYSPIEFFLGIGMQALSRRNEYQADRFAVENTRTPEAMANALKKLSVRNLSNLTPHPFYVALNYSHPPVLQRIDRITAGS